VSFKAFFTSDKPVFQNSAVSYSATVNKYLADCPPGIRGCCCYGNHQDVAVNDRFAFASSQHQTIYGLHDKVFDVQVKATQH
jgi:hypothetical protein